MMDEILALLCEANQLKLEQDIEVSMKNTHLMAFPSTGTITWYIQVISQVMTESQSVTGFHNFLCRINEASVTTEHTAGNCASGRDGPTQDMRGSGCPVKGICLCHLPPLSPPQIIIRWEFHWGNLERDFWQTGQICSPVGSKLL